MKIGGEFSTKTTPEYKYMIMTSHQNAGEKIDSKLQSWFWKICCIDFYWPQEWRYQQWWCFDHAFRHCMKDIWCLYTFACRRCLTFVVCLIGCATRSKMHTLLQYLMIVFVAMFPEQSRWHLFVVMQLLHWFTRNSQVLLKRFNVFTMGCSYDQFINCVQPNCDVSCWLP